MWDTEGDQLVKIGLVVKLQQLGTGEKMLLEAYSGKCVSYFRNQENHGKHYT